MESKSKKSYRSEYRKITIRTIDGSTLIGKVNIGENSRLSDLFTGSQEQFVVMVDVSYKDGHGKVLFVNKEHIVWAEPEEV